MKLLKFTMLSLFFLVTYTFQSQNIGDFTSIDPNTVQSASFVLSSSHTFQKIAEVGDALTAGGTFKPKPDFTAYVPIANSSTNGYLSINSEGSALTDGGGGVMVFDINFNATTELWETTASEDLDFTAVGGTAANCSGAVTPWGTVITCEEGTIPDTFPPFDGYNDLGWNIEINPATKSVVAKHYAMGNFAHENVAIQTINAIPTSRTVVYQGADSNPGYLYKYVATNFQDLSMGLLYVFKGSKSGTGSWILLDNTTQSEQNSTLTQSGASGHDATVFAGIEDVEIGPDGMVYFAVKGEGTVYRFSDSDPLETSASTVTMETFVGGGASYDINDGTSTTSVAWGNGNDNLAFDCDGNLWVFQDSGNSFIWVVKNGHTQASPDVEIFGKVPIGSEPTGITFTPDYKYLFMSIQHPDPGNAANQVDAAGNTVDFDKGTSLVIALSENLGSALSVEDENFDDGFTFYPNPIKSSKNLIIKGKQINNIKLYAISGKKLLDVDYNDLNEVTLNLKDIQSGLYLFKVNDKAASKLVIK
ncbi:alkaline phosphatase PhoX [Hwangdonia sp.]|uniref:alkaline phosphatase PhoX n=1 Tax=Hwangdonia sp. TaxID=1883432 RepID=UPI003AB48855